MQVDERHIAAEPDTGSPSPIGERRLFVNTAANAIAQAVTVLTTFVFLPLLMRDFGVQNYGLYLLASSVAAYAYLLDLGIGVVLIRRTSERVAVGDKKGVPGLLLSAATLYTVIGLVGAAVLVLVGRFAGTIFNVSPTEAALLEQLLWIGALLQLWYWPASTARQALNGLQEFRVLAVTSSISQIGGAAATLLVLVAGQGPIVLALASGAIMIATSLVDILFLTRRLRGFGKPSAPSYALMRSLVSEGLPIFGIQVADIVMKQQTDRLVLGVFLGPAAVAVYEVAAKLSALISQATGVLVSATVPVASSLNAQRRDASMQALFLRGSKYVTLLISPLVVSSVALAGVFITLWLGPQFEMSVPVARALMMAQFFVPLYVVGDSVLIGRNRYGEWLPYSVFLAVANLGLSVMLVVRFGVVGVAIGTLLACLLELPLYARLVLRELKLDYRVWLRSTTLPAYPLLAIPASICLLALRLPLTQTMLGLVAVGSVALLAYWASAYAIALSADERTRVSGLLASFRPSARGSDKD